MKLLLHVLQASPAPVLSECLFISPECRPYFLTFPLSAAPATNKTILPEGRPKGRRWCFLRPIRREKEMQYLYLSSAPRDRFYFSVPIVEYRIH